MAFILEIGDDLAPLPSGAPKKPEKTETEQTIIYKPKTLRSVFGILGLGYSARYVFLISNLILQSSAFSSSLGFRIIASGA